MTYNARYCEFCGQKLKVSFKPISYDPITGKRIYKGVRECPSRKWWNFIFHDRVWDTVDYSEDDIKT